MKIDHLISIGNDVGDVFQLRKNSNALTSGRSCSRDEWKFPEFIPQAVHKYVKDSFVLLASELTKQKKRHWGWIGQINFLAD